MKDALAAVVAAAVIASAPSARAQHGGDYPAPTIGSFESFESRSTLERRRQLLGRLPGHESGEAADRGLFPAGHGPAISGPADSGPSGPAAFAQVPRDERPPAALPYLGERREPAADPGQLKKITQILPYADYEPNPEVRRDDPCLNLCPRPDSPLCRVYPEGRTPMMCPEELLLGDGVWMPRDLPPSVFTWEASNLYHYPLYFEDAPLERYGHTYGFPVQPFVSAGRFSLHLLGLPYQMTIDPACRKIYTLGWYRPGECAPKLHYQIPWHHQAAINQALVVSGLIWLIP